MKVKILSLLTAAAFAFALCMSVTTPAAPKAPQAPPPARVRASHRVDVIGPGERVETIIDRMRAGQQAPPPAEGKSAERLPVRTPPRERKEERPPAEPARGPGARGAKAASPAAADRPRK